MTQLPRDSLENLLSPQLTFATSARKMAESHCKGDIRISTITSFPLQVHTNSLTLFCFLLLNWEKVKHTKPAQTETQLLAFFLSISVSPISVCVHMCVCVCVCACVCLFFSLSRPLFAWFIHFAKIFLWIIIISWTGKGCNSLCLLHLIIQVD